MTTIPRAASVSLWLGAWLRGAASPDDVLTAFGPEIQVFVGWEHDALGAVDALGLIRRGSSRVALALTAPGDPLGLAGPPLFNEATMDAGEAVLLPDAGIGMIPVLVGGAVEWRCSTAAAPAPLDVREARQNLTMTLRDVTEELVDLHIARWNSEIPDLLINRNTAIALPPDMASEDGDMLTRAAWCLDIVDAAARIEPGAISAWERSRFEEAMRRLDRSARRALVAGCGSASDSLTSP